MLRPAPQFALHLVLVLVRDKPARASVEPGHFAVEPSRWLRGRVGLRQNWIAQSAPRPVPRDRQYYSNRPATLLRIGLRHSSHLLIAGKRDREATAPASGSAQVSNSTQAHPAPPASCQTSPWLRPIRMRRLNHLAANQKPSSNAWMLCRNPSPLTPVAQGGGRRLPKKELVAGLLLKTSWQHSIDCRRQPASRCAANSELRL